MTCSNCAGDYENPDFDEKEIKKFLPIEARKPWRRTTAKQPPPPFHSYHARLHALAERHGIPAASLKALIEDAFGKCDSPPAEQESKQALMKLAKMKVGPCEINWLFQYHIAPEGIL